jgi:hypothetical protein
LESVLEGRLIEKFNRKTLGHPLDERSFVRFLFRAPLWFGGSFQIVILFHISLWL